MRPVVSRPELGYEPAPNPPRTALRLGTRRSKLAVAQAVWVAERLREARGQDVRLVPMSTTGDESQAPIGMLGATGVFVTALRDALLRREVDLVVHSCKDLPSAPVPALCVAAIPRREDPRDALVWRGGAGTLASLPPGTRVGTGAPRRVAQLRAMDQDLEVAPLRGNVDTRLRKVADGQVDAVVIAMAGLARLGRLGVVSSPLPTSVMMPAPTQGALAVECRADDDRLVALLAGIDHGPTRAVVSAERAFLAAMEGGCSAPMAAYAQPTTRHLGHQHLRMSALVATPDGATVLRRAATGDMARADELGRRVADLLLGDGARELLSEGSDPR